MSAQPKSTEKPTQKSPLRYDQFLDAVTNYLSPNPYARSGFPCVAGRRRSYQSGGFYSVTESLSLADQKAFRELIEEHASKLPELHYRMADEDVEKFLRAYRAIENRSIWWEPHIHLKNEREDVTRKWLALRTKHYACFAEEISRGSIRVFDVDGMPQVELDSHIFSYISRQTAQEYLDRLGLPLAEVLGDGGAAISGRAVVDNASARDADASERREAVGPKVGGGSAPSDSSTLVTLKPDFSQTERNEIAPKGSACAGDANSPGDKRKRQQRTEEEKREAIFFYDEKRFAEGAGRLQMPQKLFKQNAKRWKEEQEIKRAAEGRSERYAHAPFRGSR